MWLLDISEVKSTQFGDEVGIGYEGEGGDSDDSKA